MAKIYPTTNPDAGKLIAAHKAARPCPWDMKPSIKTKPESKPRRPRKPFPFR